MKKGRLSIYALLISMLFLQSCQSENEIQKRLTDTLGEKTLEIAEKNISAIPITITSFIAERSAGTSHDFYSEGDYWWPNPLNPEGPYIRRDGETNPDNFTEHRQAMIRFSQIVGNLTSAYLLTENPKYIEPILQHIRAWFTNPETLMNPNLLYAQAIKGITTGRGIGIIDTIHLIEVVQSLIRLEEKGILPQDDLANTKKWFSDYLKWLTTHPYGIDEMKATNNHGTCWAMQAAIFAKYTGNKEIMQMCTERFKKIFMPKQMDVNGSFPQELERTKPYGYSLFNLDAMATLCQILSTSTDNLWEYTTPDGKNMQKAIRFMYPYIINKETWPFPHDVMYWEEWPVAQPALLFAWNQYRIEEYFQTWQSLNHFPENEEVIRNLPIRNPIIWLY